MKKSKLFFLISIFVSKVFAGPFLEKVGQSDMIFRGRAPKSSEINKLRDKGITKVLIFKIESTDEVEKQRQWMIAEGYKDQDIIHIEFPWKDIKKPRQACQQIIQALQVLKEVSESSSDHILFHCTVGEDRTGLLAGLWTQLKDSEDMMTAYKKQMCKKGYSGGNKSKPPHVQDDIDKNLTPLYEYVSGQIASGHLTLDQLDESACRGLPTFTTQWGFSVPATLAKCVDLN